METSQTSNIARVLDWIDGHRVLVISTLNTVLLLALSISIAFAVRTTQYPQALAEEAAPATTDRSVRTPISGKPSVANETSRTETRSRSTATTGRRPASGRTRAPATRRSRQRTPSRVRLPEPRTRTE